MTQILFFDIIWPKLNLLAFRPAIIPFLDNNRFVLCYEHVAFCIMKRIPGILVPQDAGETDVPYILKKRVTFV